MVIANFVITGSSQVSLVSGIKRSFVTSPAATSKMSANESPSASKDVNQPFKKIKLEAPQT